MPAPINTCLYGQIFFGDKGDPVGWSEGYWLNGVDYAKAFDNLKSVIYPARRGIMAQDLRAVSFRVSKTTIRGDTITQKIDPDDTHPPTFNQKAKTECSSLPDGVAIYARFNTANNRIWCIKPLRAVPSTVLDLIADDESNTALIGDDAKAFKSLFDRFSDSLVGIAGCVSRVPPADPVILDCTIPVAPDKTLVTGASTALINPGQQAICPGFLPSGTYVVSKTSGTITVSKESLQPVPFTASVTFKNRATGSFTYEPITGAELDNQVRYRKIGRPFGLLRGRRRVKK